MKVLYAIRIDLYNFGIQKNMVIIEKKFDIYVYKLRKNICNECCVYN